MLSYRFLLSCLLPLCAATLVQAYPGADVGPKPWRPARGKPSPFAGLMLLPPSPVLQALQQAGIPSSSLGFYARRVDARRPFAALNEEQPFQLASTAKLVTSLAALDLLGADYRWSTQAYALGDIVDGRLDGDLLIVGGGDATLRSDALRRWFVALHEQGLREIGGDIVIDRLAFALDPADLARTPSPEAGRPHHAWPDAFSLDEGLLRVAITPLPKGRSSVQLQPPLAGVQIETRLVAGPGCSAHAEMSEAGAGSGALRRLALVGSATPECGVLQLELMPLSHPEFTTRAIAALWTESGGRLHGRVHDRSAVALPAHEGEGEPAPPYASHPSEKLPALLRDTNKTSNNLLARHLLLSLAPGFPQQRATLAAARERVQAWLVAQGLAAEDIEIDSGAGLSRLERGKPRALVQLLAQAWAGRAAQPFVESLPVAGVDGTLARRFQNGAATGQAFLKTGSLNDTRALAGYVKARSGKVYAVAALLNHPDAALGAPALDALIEWIAATG